MTDPVERLLIRRDMKLSGGNPDAKVTAASLVEFGQAVGEEIAKLVQRISALEKRLEGQQKKLDHVDNHALTFRGEWQPAERYYPGNVIRHYGNVFVALRDISPAKAAPGRDGSGWDRIV